MKRITLLLVMPLAAGQTTVNEGAIKRTWDASGATSTLPYRTGSGSPAGRHNCDQPDFQTEAPAGQNVWGCTAC